jgi:hypothetical protein
VTLVEYNRKEEKAIHAVSAYKSEVRNLDGTSGPVLVEPHTTPLVSDSCLVCLFLLNKNFRFAFGIAQSMVLTFKFDMPFHYSNVSRKG